MKVKFEASDKLRLWPWLIVAALILIFGEFWILSEGARVLVFSKKVADPLIEGRDCWYFTGTWIEGSFDALESCPWLRDESRSMFR